MDPSKTSAAFLRHQRAVLHTALSKRDWSDVTAVSAELDRHADLLDPPCRVEWREFLEFTIAVCDGEVMGCVHGWGSAYAAMHIRELGKPGMETLEQVFTTRDEGQRVIEEVARQLVRDRPVPVAHHARGWPIVWATDPDGAMHAKCNGRIVGNAYYNGGGSYVATVVVEAENGPDSMILDSNFTVAGDARRAVERYLAGPSK